jgi:hypothetical protein
VRLFGQSPAGLNSTGESDLRTYYDNVTRSQDRQLRPGISVLLSIVYRSLFGKAPPDDFTFDFAPLYDMNDTERATVAKTTTDAIVAAEGAGIITKATALKELKQSSEATGIFTNIGDDEITEAENEPPPPDEMDMLEAQTKAKMALAAPPNEPQNAAA